MNNSNDWSLGEQWILFPENLNISLDLVSGNIDVRGKQIHCSSRDKSLNDLISDFCYSAKQNKSTFWKTSWVSRDNIRPPPTERSDQVQQWSTFHR